MGLDTWGNADSGQAWVYSSSYGGAAPTTGFHYWVDGSYGVMSMVADGSHTQIAAQELTLPVSASDWLVGMECQLYALADHNLLASGTEAQGIGLHNSGGSALCSAIFNPYSSGTELTLKITTPGGSTTTYTASPAGLPTYLGSPALPYLYWLKLEGMTDGARCKFWLSGTTEPTSWTIEEHPTSGMTYTTFDAIAEATNATAITQFQYASFTGTATVTITATPQNGQPYPITVIATGDGTTTTFTLPTGYQSGSIICWVDGLQQDVTEVDPTAGTFSLSFAPLAASGGLPAEVVEAYWVVET